MALEIDYREFNPMYPHGHDFLKWRVVDVFGVIHEGEGLYYNNCYGERFEAVIAAAGKVLAGCVSVQWESRNGVGFIRCSINAHVWARGEAAC